jgi:hypothetical protein
MQKLGFTVVALDWPSIWQNISRNPIRENGTIVEGTFTFIPDVASTMR